MSILHAFTSCIAMHVHIHNGQVSGCVSNGLPPTKCFLQTLATHEDTAVLTTCCTSPSDK